jgi:hypothetical protein
VHHGCKAKNNDKSPSGGGIRAVVVEDDLCAVDDRAKGGLGGVEYHGHDEGAVKGSEVEGVKSKNSSRLSSTRGPTTLNSKASAACRIIIRGSSTIDVARRYSMVQFGDAVGDNRGQQPVGSFTLLSFRARLRTCDRTHQEPGIYASIGFKRCDR